MPNVKKAKLKSLLKKLCGNVNDVCCVNNELQKQKLVQSKTTLVPPRGASGPATPPQQGPCICATSTPTGGDTGRRGGVNKYGTAGTLKWTSGIGKPHLNKNLTP